MNELDQLFKIAISQPKKKRFGFALIVGTVKQIDGDACIVDDYEAVRLNAVIDNLESQFTVYPKIGSKVIIGKLENESDMFVVRVSEIEKVKIKIENQLFEITAEKFSVEINDQLFEMKDGKFSIKVGSVSLKSILNNAFQKLKTAIITTPSGPGQFSPADKVAFEQYNNQVNQLLS